MSGATAGILVLAVLLLPTLGALAGRLLSRFGPRIALAVTLLSFGGSAGLALFLLISGAEFPTTPGWASLLPRQGPALQTLAFDTARDRSQPAGELVVAALPPVVAEPGEVAAIVPPTTTTRPTPEPRLPTATAVLAQSPASPTFYVVQAGDTLRSIAERLGVSVQALLAANDLSADAGDQLGIGQELRVPVESAAGAVESTPAPLDPTSTPVPEPTPTKPPVPTPVPPTSTPAPPRPTPAPPAPTVRPEPPSAEVRTYVVKQGDTLRSIAAQFGLTVEALLRFNGLSGAEGDRLTLGQRIYIPATAPRPTVVVQSYIVKQGDTLRSIAAQYGVTVEALQSYNGLSAAEADRLRPGQKLLIPPR